MSGLWNYDELVIILDHFAYLFNCIKALNYDPLILKIYSRLFVCEHGCIIPPLAQQKNMPWLLHLFTTTSSHCYLTWHQWFINDDFADFISALYNISTCILQKKPKKNVFNQILKGIVQAKKIYIYFQTCITVFVHLIEVSLVQNNIGPQWPSLYRHKKTLKGF